MSHFLRIAARDSLVARDGRPFGATQGHRMKSLDWIYPSVTAGMVRTLLGHKNGGDFGPQAVAALKAVSVAGPLPMFGQQLLFPVPRDLEVEEDPRDQRRTAWASRPSSTKEAGEGTDLPAHIMPALLPEDVGDNFKPARVPPFWSREKATAWLLNAKGAGFEAPPDASLSPGDLLERGYLRIEKDERFHVKIDPASYSAVDTQLFTTVALAMPEGVGISVRVETDVEVDQWASLGGEHRLVHVRSRNQEDAWACPADIREALCNTKRIRMVLATPALFADGWKPAWIDSAGRGQWGGVTLQLVGACVDRWKPISGWSYEAPRGPKPVRRLVPAGCVYFFETEQNAAALADQWLQPVSDFGADGQSARDGFGLALWGRWAPHSE
jgi:CRISPR-associated protein Cmr3